MYNSGQSGTRRAFPRWMDPSATRGMRLEHRSQGDGAPCAADIVLARRIRSGDADALGELFDRHGSAALAAATELLADAAAEDVVHDAFVTVWQKIGEFDDNLGTLGVWVLALTRQHANHHRQLVRR